MDQQALEYFGEQDDVDGIDRLQVNEPEAILETIIGMAEEATSEATSRDD